MTESKADPLSDEEVIAVDVGVELEELLQGHPRSLRHGEARLTLLHSVHRLAVQRRCQWVCVRQGDRDDKEARDRESSGATVCHCNASSLHAKEAASRNLQNW